MHHRTAALIGGLVVALAACADGGSTPVTPEAAKPRLLVSPTVSLSCYPDGQWCEATASGGNPGEYSFEWSWPAIEQDDANGYSTANVVCYPAYGWFTISVTVSDGNGGTGSASAWLFCPP
jgi:hypothetical protein